MTDNKFRQGHVPRSPARLAVIVDPLEDAKMPAWKLVKAAEAAWLESWEAAGAPVFPGNFDEFVAQKERFLSRLRRRLTKIVVGTTKSVLGVTIPW